MGYWTYERPITDDGVWIRKAIPWTEAKPSKRHADRKITHVYECLVNTKHEEYFSDHTQANIWMKSCVIVVVSPLITIMQSLYHILGIGLIKESATGNEGIEALSSRCIKELKKIYLIPYYGFCQIILALGIIFSTPFGKKASCNLRRLIGKVQHHPEAEKYFSNTFEPLFLKEVSESKLSAKIRSTVKQVNRLFRGIIKVPFYKSHTHREFVNSDLSDPEGLVEYFSQSYSELYRLYRKDYRTEKLRLNLIKKLNVCYKQLDKHNPAPTSPQISFNLEKNEIKKISNNPTYQLMNLFKRSLSKSHINLSTRKKRFLTHSLEEIYQIDLRNNSKRLVKTNFDSKSIKKLARSTRKKFSTYLKNFQNTSEENKQFLPNKKLVKANKKLRKIVRSNRFSEIVKNDHQLLQTNINFLNHIRKQVTPSSLIPN